MARVLIVDDEETVRHLLRRIIMRDGHETAEAENGAAALEEIAREKPDVVITDILMPVMDGLALCRKLRSKRETQDIPILVVTAQTGDESMMGAIRAGAEDFISKPFRPGEIHVRVRSMLKISGLRDEVQRAYAYLEEMKKQQSGARNRAGPFRSWFR